jgi:hypothetical protein
MGSKVSSPSRWSWSPAAAAGRIDALSAPFLNFKFLGHGRLLVGVHVDFEYGGASRMQKCGDAGAYLRGLGAPKAIGAAGFGPIWPLRVEGMESQNSSWKRLSQSLFHANQGVASSK